MNFAAHLDHATALAEAAIMAAAPDRLVRQALSTTGRGVLVAGQLYAPARLFLVAAGKAAIAMAGAAADALGERLTAGVVIGKQATAHLPPPLRYLAGDHPVPGAGSLRATRAVLDLLATTQPDDLVLGLISGGTSALLTQPVLPLAQWQALTQTLLHSGCTIDELNTVRRQLDQVKGGGLARLAAPAQVAALILSDVIGNDLALIGSGPTAPTPSDPAGARAVLDRYAVWAQLDAPTAIAVRQALANVAAEATLPAAYNHIIGDVGLAARAAAEAAQGLGFSAEIHTTTLAGEARDVGRWAAATVRALPPGRCLIAGGETTVSVRGDGCGGRNQELALAAALELVGADRRAVIAFSTDGDDGVHPPGSPPMAGAVVTGDTCAQARARGLDPAAFLAASDSYRFFEALGRGHLAARQGTNVNDLLILLHYEHAD